MFTTSPAILTNATSRPEPAGVASMAAKSGKAKVKKDVDTDAYGHFAALPG